MPFGDPIPGVMGSGSWEQMGTDQVYPTPLPTYNAGGEYYVGSGDGITSGIMWSTPFTGAQSIEVTVSNFAAIDDPGENLTDLVVLECRKPDGSGDQYFGEGLHVAFYWQQVGTDSLEDTLTETFSYEIVYNDADSNQLYYLYVPEDFGYIVWPYSLDPFSMRLESDVDGAFRIYVNDALFFSDTVPGMPDTGASKVGVVVSGSGDEDDRVRVSDIYIRTTAAAVVPVGPLGPAPFPIVLAYFDVTGASGLFILNDPVRGVLDGTDYLLAGDVAIDITSHVRSVHIRRGRERALDQITVGVANLVANNHTRLFDPSYVGSPFYGNIRPGKRITISAAGINIFDGLIDDWNFDYQATNESTASFDVVDALATLGAKEFDEWTTTAGQLPGARLNDILDRDEVRYPAGARNIDAGTSTLQADTVSWGSNVLNYAQLIASADLGQLFAARDGTLTFYGRNRTVTAVGAPEFRDDGAGGGIGYAAVSVGFGTELLYNRVSVDATGFTQQTATDQDSIDLYGIRSLSLSSLPLDSESQALGLAEYLLGVYKNPESRFTSITVNLHGIPVAVQEQVINLDIGSAVRVVYTPNGIGSAIDKFCLVEGLEHTMGPAYHQVVLKLSNLGEGFNDSPFILDDTTAGVLDSAYVLAF